VTDQPLPELLYRLAPEQVEHARIREFQRWLAIQRNLELPSYAELHAWSVSDLEGFWEAIWQYYGVRAYTPYDKVLAARTMPGARWFTGATLNYAEHCFGRPEDADTVAVSAYSQTRAPVQLTFAELAEQVRRVRDGLRRLGVRRGDRVVGYLPNCPEALIAFLALPAWGRSGPVARPSSAPAAWSTGSPRSNRW
jgi:acetoacetyl-CoA synthetase